MTSGMLFALSLGPFNLQAALIVGAIVVVGAAIVLTAGIATPVIAIQAGATIKGTILAVTAISLTTGAIAATAAGMYWGRQGEMRRQEQIAHIKRVSNQLDVHFEVSKDDPQRAVPFQCTVVVYEESDLTSQEPTVTTKKLRISANDAAEFYNQVERHIGKWFSKSVEGDREGSARRIVIFMRPYPGEGTYDRIKEIADRTANRNSVVLKNEGSWASALAK